MSANEIAFKRKSERATNKNGTFSTAQHVKTIYPNTHQPRLFITEKNWTTYSSLEKGIILHLSGKFIRFSNKTPVLRLQLNVVSKTRKFFAFVNIRVNELCDRTKCLQTISFMRNRTHVVDGNELMSSMSWKLM